MIRAKVIRILSNTQLVINAGEWNGVTPGTRFKVVGTGEEIIVDPENGNILGTLENIKTCVVPHHIDMHFSIMRTQERTEWESRWTSALGGISKTVSETFPVKAEDVNPLFGNDSVVRVGDDVIEIEEG